MRDYISQLATLALCVLLLAFGRTAQAELVQGDLQGNWSGTVGPNQISFVVDGYGDITSGGMPALNATSIWGSIALTDHSQTGQRLL